MYSAIIIDIKESQKLDSKTRINFQKKLQEVITLLNNRYNRKIKYKLVFSSGDSVRGLFYHLEDAFKYYFQLKDLLYPLQVCAGIGRGNIIIDFENYDSNMQDGPAYHHALSALNFCKEENLDAFFRGWQQGEYFLNELLYLINIFEKDQSAKQKDITNLINLLIPIGYQIELNDLQKFILTNIKHYDKIDMNHLKIDGNYNNATFSKHLFSPSLAQKVSLIVGTSRENIRQIIVSGKINEIRKLQLLMLNFINQYYQRSEV